MMNGVLGERVRDGDLTDAELRLLRTLPGPPPRAEIRTTNVWIIEWLFPDDQKTGKLLHDWMQERRPGWSAYSSCRSEADVIEAIERATVRARQSGMIPVLHIEAHGDEVGLGGPHTGGSAGLITWDELADPLQRLNLMTRCNLGVFVAACTGFAAIMTFTRGPRAPAAWLVGPDDTVTQADLLRGTKEFYRRWIDKVPRLSDIAASASLETEPVALEPESFALIAFESLAQCLIISMHPNHLYHHIDHIGRYIQGAGVIERTNADLSSISIAMFQQSWDKLFMIDLYPENRQRFGVDMSTVIKMVLEYYG
jgi:hypothetical protein